MLGKGGVRIISCIACAKQKLPMLSFVEVPQMPCARVQIQTANILYEVSMVSMALYLSTDTIKVMNFLVFILEANNVLL